MTTGEPIHWVTEPTFTWSVMTPLGGIRVVPNRFVEPVAKLHVRDSIPLTDEFRAAMNRWLLDMFGTTEVAYFINPGALGLMGEEIMVVSPKGIAAIRAMTAQRPSAEGEG